MNSKRIRTIFVGLIWIVAAFPPAARGGQDGMVGQGPRAPVLLTPANNVLNVPTTQVLTWVGSDSAKLGYDVYFGTKSTPPKVAAVLKAAYAPIGMQPQTKYYWRIVAKNSTGTTSTATWNFTTAASGTPVNCVLSSWTMSSALPWSACSQSGTQTRIETWTRTIVVPPSNGGTACGPLTEQRTATRSCTVPPPGSLLQKADLVYQGAFRVPLALDLTRTFDYGGQALTYHPAHDSLLMVGHDWYQQVGEFSIPTPLMGTSLANLQRAAWKQPLTDVLQGKRYNVDGDKGSGVKIGGLTVLPNSLAVTAWDYYDNGVAVNGVNVRQTLSHFTTGQNFSTLTQASVTGPFKVGIGFQNIVATDMQRIGGFVSGYMATIPPGYQSLLGGTHLTGQGGFISIATRTSSGPSATAFTPNELGVPNTPATMVMGYPADPNNPTGPLHHPTLGQFRVGGGLGLYDGTQGFRGMVFPENYRSILFFGWGGTDFCYGTGTSDPALHKQPNAGNPGTMWCYDPVPGNTGNYGTHGYPYRSLVYAYDVNDFIAVKQGTKKPWDVVPYATWTFSLPLQQKLVNGVDIGVYDIVGAAYDPAGRRLFVAAYKSDGAAPLIHVFGLP